MEAVDMGTSLQVPPEKTELKTVDVINLCRADREKADLLKSQAIKGDSPQLKDHITKTAPILYSMHETELDNCINFVPAWSYLQGDQRHICLNTGMVNNADFAEIYLHHEAIEAVIGDKNLGIDEIASQLEVDPDLIRADYYNDPAHYVALYHELKLAKNKGMLEDQIKNRRKMIGTVINDSFLPMYKLNDDGSTNPDWQPMFKESAKEYADLNLNIFMQLANRFRAQVNSPTPITEAKTP